MKAFLYCSVWHLLLRRHCSFRPCQLQPVYYSVPCLAVFFSSRWSYFQFQTSFYPLIELSVLTWPPALQRDDFSLESGQLQSSLTHLCFILSRSHSVLLMIFYSGCRSFFPLFVEVVLPPCILHVFWRDSAVLWYWGCRAGLLFFSAALLLPGSSP